MSRSFWLSLATYALILAALVTLRGEFLLLALPLVAYMAASFLTIPEAVELTVERMLSADRVTVGAPVVVQLRITNVGPHLAEALLVDRVPDALAIESGTTRRLFSLGSGETATFCYTASGPRGAYPFTQVHVEARDPFGLLRRTADIRTSGHLLVLTSILRIDKIPIRTRRTRVYAGTIPARLGGHGVEFFGVREYQSGDPPRLINWRASARHPSDLFANEYEQERVADVGIVLDGRARTNHLGPGRSLFEYSVLAAAAMAEALLGQGNRVGLLEYGRFLQWTFPGYGKLQRERILQALAGAETGGSAVFSGLEYLPTRLFPPHSQMILVSPLAAEDDQVLVQLRARGYQLMVISPDPVRFELGFLPGDRAVELAGRVVRMEREVLLRKLKRAGIQVLDWDVSLPFDRVIKSQLGRSPAFWRAVGARI